LPKQLAYISIHFFQEQYVIRTTEIP